MSRAAPLAPVCALGASLALALAACHPSRAAPERDLGAAIIDLAGRLPGPDLDSLRTCHKVVMHPMIGREPWSLALTHGGEWHTLGRLPVHVGDTRHYGPRVLTFRPFDLYSRPPSPPPPTSCQAVAASLWSHTRDRAMVVFDVFVPQPGGWRPEASIAAAARRSGSGWQLSVVGVNW